MPFASSSRFVREEDFGEFLRFFAEHWGAEHILARDPEFARWQMSPSRCDTFRDAALAGLGYWSENQLAGFIGCMPMLFNIDGRTVQGSWLCNLLAAPQALRKGVGLKLMAGVHRLPFMVIGAAGINTAVLPMYRAMHYITGDCLPRWIRVLDHEAFASLASEAGLHAAGAEPPTKTGNGATVVERVASMPPADWDPVWMNISERGYLGTHRDASYMNWRYAEHPRLAYHIALARGDRGRAAGCAVWRVEQVKDSSHRVARLLEWHADGAPASTALLHHVEQDARAAGAAMIDYYSSRPDAVGLSEAGWFPEADAPDGPIPSLFQPLEPRSRPINFAVWTHPKALDHHASIADRLFVGKSDGDQDRPN